jgi:hypothetical protein
MTLGRVGFFIVYCFYNDYLDNYWNEGVRCFIVFDFGVWVVVNWWKREGGGGRGARRQARRSLKGLLEVDAAFADFN